jgi:micrococcal nuclease
MKPLTFSVILSFLSTPALAAHRVILPHAPFTAIILACHDGDTCLALTPDHHRVKIRLAHCDSPEMEQPGKWPLQPGAYEAHTAIDNLILGKAVTVIPTGTESYHRTVADIHFSNFDVCEEMAREGEAMIDPRYTHDTRLFMTQDEAAKEKRGLWRDRAPICPWEWRVGKR